MLPQHQIRIHRARPTGNANPRFRRLYVEQRMLLAFAVSDAVMLPATPDPPVAAAQVEITFNEPIERGSLSASDLVLNGAPAAAVSARGETMAVFELPAVEGAGPHVVTIAAGAVQQADQQRTPVEPFRAEFRLDTAEQWIVHHPPRLQLGDAPLFPFGSSQSDQVEILWQTLPAGEGDRDQFTVEYRSAEGNAAWNVVDVNPPLDLGNVTLDTGVEGRMIHSASITGLDYDQAYDYRVRQLRDKVVVDAYQSTFQTRLPVNHPSAFSFAAYGDSASVSANHGFRAVQDRINRSSAEFSLLLGDNYYEVGFHREADARFSTNFSPEATEWVASHIDYFALGNHDVAYANGQSSRDNFSVPVPRAGINAHAEPPASEPPEHNYSFDYGSARFATFDTNSLNDPERLDSQLTWLEQDLAASDATWKIVFGHHPVAFVPDKSESPGDNYYRQVVPRLHDAGADMFMVGHSHTYSRTKPLFGEDDGVATFIDDADSRYDKGVGLVQVVAGTGGNSLRGGAYAGPGLEAVGAGFSLSTTPPAEDGFALVDVTPTELIVRYVAAGDGRILDTFSIVNPGKPVVSIMASDEPAAEQGIVSSSFTVTRRGNLDTPIDVFYELGGTASATADYRPLSGRVQLAAGQQSAAIELVPTDDRIAEGEETVTVILAPRDEYVLGGPFEASLAIADDEIITQRFQQGADGYMQTRDTYLLSIFGDNDDNSAARTLLVQVPGAIPLESQGLLRFDGIFGSSNGQIPVNADIRSAHLQVTVVDPGGGLALHAMLEDWQHSASWNSVGGGIKADDLRASATADAVTGTLDEATHALEVTERVRSWQADHDSNRGWLLVGAGSDAVTLNSAEGLRPPGLVVEYSVDETQALTGRITEIVPNPRRQAVQQLTVEFSAPVTGFELSDVVLSHDGIESPLPANVVLQSLDNRVWTLDSLGPLTDRPGRYVFSIREDGSGIQDLAGNRLLDDVFASWTDEREPGDANGDGMFDQRDIVAVLRLNRFGTSASWREGDWNMDGIFDSQDVELARRLGRYRPQ